MIVSCFRCCEVGCQYFWANCSQKFNFEYKSSVQVLLRETDKFGGQDNTNEFLFAGGSCAAVPMSGDRKNLNKPTRGRKKSIFEAYMSKEDVSAGLKRGELIQVPGTCKSMLL